MDRIGFRRSQLCHAMSPTIPISMLQTRANPPYDVLHAHSLGSRLSVHSLGQPPGAPFKAHAIGLHVHPNPAQSVVRRDIRALLTQLPGSRNHCSYVILTAVQPGPVFRSLPAAEHERHWYPTRYRTPTHLIRIFSKARR